MFIACSIKHCAACLDDSTCNMCNAPYVLNQDNECELCQIGTYFDEDAKSCAGIFLK